MQLRLNFNRNEFVTGFSCKSACKQHNDVATAALACVAAACTAGPAPGFVERGAGGAVVASLVEACLAPDGSLLTPSAAAVAGEGLKALNAMARTGKLSLHPNQ